MSSLRIAAVVLAAVVSFGGIPAVGADLYGPKSYGEARPDDDPRYSDIYRHPPPPPPRYAAPYVPRDSGDGPPVYRDERGYLRPMSPPSYGPRYRHDDFATSCVAPDVVRVRLERQGWHDFRDVMLEGGVAVLRARAANGRRFEISVDRCSGEVLEARPVWRRAARMRRDWEDRRRFDRY